MHSTWTRTAPNTPERTAAIITDCFNRAKTYGRSAPRDVEAALRFAMQTPIDQAGA